MTCALALFWSLTSAHAAPALTSHDRLTGLVAGLMTEGMQTNGATGGAVAVAVVTPDGVFHMCGDGHAQLVPDPAPAHPGTLFQAASVSKIFVHLAVMQMVEDGRIALVDPIDQHLPAHLQPAADGFAEPIRVQNLPNHTAGFEDAIPPGGARSPDMLTTTGSKRAGPRRIRAPGVRPSEPNHGADLLAAAVAHVSGRRFEDYVTRRPEQRREAS